MNNGDDFFLAVTWGCLYTFMIQKENQLRAMSDS